MNLLEIIERVKAQPWMPSTWVRLYRARKWHALRSASMTYCGRTDLGLHTSRIWRPSQDQACSRCWRKIEADR